MKKKTIKQLKATGFICTDASQSTEQWVKKIDSTCFEIYERHNNTTNFVELAEFTEAELEKEISGYYGSLRELRKLYGNDSNQIIAECISEQL